MTKHLVYAIMLLGMMLTATGCSDEVFETPGTEQSAKGEKVTITVCLPENDADNQNHSRIAFNDETLKLTWQEGDEIEIWAFDATNHFSGLSDLTLSSGAGTTKAQFTGDWFSEDADHYQVFYNHKRVDMNSTINCQGQIQTGNNNTDHLKDFLVLSSGEEPLQKEDILNGNFVLTPMSSVFRFNIAGYPKEKIGKLQQIIWYSNYDEDSSPATSLTLRIEDETSTNQELVAYMAFDPSLMKLKENQTIALTLIGDKGIGVVKGTSTDGVAYLPGKRYTAKVSEANETSSNELNTWVENLLNPAKNEILVTMSDNLKINALNGLAAERIEGTKCYYLHNGKNPITTLEAGMFLNNIKLLAVHFPATLTEIPANCFQGCRNLSSVKFSSNKKELAQGALTKIGDEAFDGCNSLSSINLPEGITSIGRGAFSGSSIKEMQLPSTVKTLGTGVFTMCEKLTSIHIPDNVEIIPRDFLSNCPNLKSVTGCKGVTTIEKAAFVGCHSLVHYPFTEKLTTIQDWAFKDCSKFTTPLPLTVTKMGNNIMGGCGITEFTIHDNLTVIKEGNQPIKYASLLTKLNVTTAKEEAVYFIPTISPKTLQPSKIDLYILKDWASKEGNLKADVASKTWNGLTWKSITLID